jgi:hypothetical protein
LFFIDAAKQQQGHAIGSALPAAAQLVPACGRGVNRPGERWRPSRARHEGNDLDAFRDGPVKNDIPA